jgi:hypothetical protein
VDGWRSHVAGSHGGFPFPEVPVDGTTCEAVQNHPAQELGIRSLDLLGLGSDVPGEPDIDLDGARLPHRHTS